MEGDQINWKNLHIANQISEVASFIIKRLGVPDLALVLGSGLKGIKDELIDQIELPYEEIPYMPRATVLGHGRKLILGKIGDKKVLCWSGRVHGYQGYSPFQVSFIAYVSAFLGAKAIIITNAAGGNDKKFQVGSIMMINDYIAWSAGCPEYSSLKDCMLGPRNMHAEPIFNAYLQEKSRTIAEEMKMELHQGNYCFTSGPTFESLHDIKIIRKLGGHTVGMSTVPEIFAARQLKLNVLAFSLVTNMASGLSEVQLSHNDVFNAAKQAGPRMQKYIRTIIEKIELDQLSSPVTPSQKLLLSLDYSVLNSQNFPQDFSTKRLNRQTLIEITQFIIKKLEISEEDAIKRVALICAPLKEICEHVDISKAVSLDQIASFPKFTKSAFTSKIFKLAAPSDTLILACPREQCFHQTESYALIEILKEIGIQHFNILLPGNSLQKEEGKLEIDQIFDYSDRNYCTALTRMKIDLQDDASVGKSLVCYQGPVYMTPAEKHIFANFFEYNYYCISNLSIAFEIDRNHSMSRSIFVLPLNFDAPGFDFSRIKLSKEIMARVLEPEKPSYKFDKHALITKSFKFAGQFQILVPEDAQFEMIEAAAKILKKKLSAQTSVLVISSQFAAALIHHMTVLNAINFVYYSGVKAHLLEVQSNDVKFLVLLSDIEDRAGELSLATVITPIRVLKLAGIQNFIFLNILTTPKKELREKIALFKDRMIWNMKNALIGENIEDWGPRFPDISKQIYGDFVDNFIQIWKNLSGKAPQELVAMWVNESKPYRGPSDLKTMEKLECDGFLKSPVNQINAVVHMNGKAFCILFPLKNQEECRVNNPEIELLFTRALPQLFKTP